MSYTCTKRLLSHYTPLYPHNGDLCSTSTYKFYLHHVHLSLQCSHQFLFSQLSWSMNCSKINGDSAMLLKQWQPKILFNFSDYSWNSWLSFWSHGRRKEGHLTACLLVLRNMLFYVLQTWDQPLWLTFWMNSMLMSNCRFV